MRDSAALYRSTVQSEPKPITPNGRPSRVAREAVSTSLIEQVAKSIRITPRQSDAPQTWRRGKLLVRMQLSGRRMLV
jgi:hypothetical protein